MNRIVRAVIVAVFAFLSAQSVRAATPVSALPTVDFEHWYPWLVWASTEGHDAEFPQGFRYKLMSVRSADSKTVEFVLERELHDGSKTIAIHATGPLDRFEDSAGKMVNNLSRKLGVTFQRFDLRDVQDFAALEERSKSFGWNQEPGTVPHE